MIEQVVVSESDNNVNSAVTKKTAACAVSLAAAVIDEIVGRDISNIRTQSAHELVTASILNELKV